MKVSLRAVWVVMFVVIGAFVIQLALTAAAQDPRKTIADSQNGRFSLFQGYYEMVSNEVLLKDKKGVFKIDTQTGDVWIFSADVIENVWSSGWVPVESE